MSLKVPDKAKGITFVQNNEPSDKADKDTWYDPNSHTVRMFYNSGAGENWYRIMTRFGPGANYGYCCGSSLIIDRITFPFDSGTASYVGNLTIGRHSLAGCNSSNYGYCMSGYDGSNYFSIIDRIVFPFNSGTASHVGNINGSRGWVAGCNSSNYGYCMSGNDGSNFLSTIDRIAFPFDSGTASHVGNINGSKYTPAGCNSSNYGYCMGGWLAGIGNFSIIDRITFPFDSGTASHVGNLSQARCDVAGCNSSIHGYCMGSWPSMSTIDRITFPFDSGTASHVGNLSGSRAPFAGCNSTNYGYCMSGVNGSNNVRFSTIDRIAFPFDSGTASHVGNLSGSRRNCTGVDGTDFVRLF